jgi:hypothetical protein
LYSTPLEGATKPTVSPLRKKGGTRKESMGAGIGFRKVELGTASLQMALKKKDATGHRNIQ